MGYHPCPSHAPVPKVVDRTSASFVFEANANVSSNDYRKAVYQRDAAVNIRGVLRVG
jgi:hypothetical protein